ncbi:hypothetical protein ACFWFI_09440 [Streptomyces sp. NPDC060209]|uniref:hypothetical protein n=1 Tax=Streptomyces sp. NPDC060209 TaxID=3347073 RepID=UPI00364DD52A
MAMFRYEPVPRDAGVEEALAAATHDAAWFLARQYGFGEFRGDDAATPVNVSIAQERHPLDNWRGDVTEEAAAGDATAEGDRWKPYDPSTMVLESLVEQELQDGPDARLSITGAIRWRRALAGAGLLGLLPAFARVCSFGPYGGLAPAALAATVRDRLPDPVALAKWLERIAARDEAAAEKFGVPSESREALASTAAQWLAWWKTRVPEPVEPAANTWDRNRMEYSFSVRASTLPEVELRAAEYHGGHLDWWAVDAPPARVPVAEAMVTRDQRKTIPTPAGYGGMPVARFWEMEDARIDFGSIDASPADLGRLLLVAFATVYDNDWFCAPLPTLAGSLSRVVECTVSDVFGGESVLAHATAEDADWNVYGLGETSGGAAMGGGSDSATPAPSPWFYRAASLSGGLESPPLESVLLLRDEQANLAWAVEETVADRADQPIDRYNRWIAGPPPGPVAVTPANGAAPAPAPPAPAAPPAAAAAADGATPAQPAAPPAPPAAADGTAPAPPAPAAPPAAADGATPAPPAPPAPADGATPAPPAPPAATDGAAPAPLPPPESAVPDRRTHYKVATEVPAHWYPLVPQSLADQESYRLHLVRLVRSEWAPPRPLGRLLTETDWVHEEEVPRSGIRVERSRQYARASDGTVHAWTTRRKRSGTGSGSSGLRFDVLEES